MNCDNCNIEKIEKFPHLLGALYCPNNKLSILDNLPDTLTILICNNNKLRTLKLPENILLVDCDDNNLSDLKTPHNINILHYKRNKIQKLKVNSFLHEIYYDDDTLIDRSFDLLFINGRKSNIEQLKNREIEIKIPREEICIISREFLIDKKYIECRNCHEQFLEEILIEWLKKKHTCPNCNVIWQWNDKIYLYKKIDT
jgi:hypothetical protein